MYTLISTPGPVAVAVAGTDTFRLSTPGPFWTGTERLWDTTGTVGSSANGATKGVDEMPAVFLQLALP